MLKLVLGKSGAGKSYKMYQEMIQESMNNPQGKYFAIVPEQFTMETQKDFVQMHPRHGIQNIDILSFMRLAYRVFEEQGKRQGTILEDTGKSMLVRKVVSQKKEQLHIFKNNIKKTGYVNEIKSLLSEFLQYGIKREDLEDIIELAEKKPMLQQKLQDMLVIYDGFRELLSEKYITAEEILEVLTDCVGRSQLLKDSIVCLDGFTGFTPVQYKLLREMLKQCKEVRISITIDPREDIYREGSEFALFHLSKETILKLLDMSKKIGIKHSIEWVGAGEIPYRFQKSPSLACLEENLFRFPPRNLKSYQKEHNIEKIKKDIHIFSAKDIQGEVDYACSEIFRLIRKEGYRYRDVAIVTGDMEQYSRIIEKAFDKVDFPVFIDYKKHIMGNPLVELVRALLEIYQQNFDYESVFRYLRCGLVDMDREDVDKLENYVIALGIKGKKRWGQKWTRTYGQENAVSAEEIDKLRIQVMEHLEEIGKVFGGRKKTVLTYTTALHEYFQKEAIYHKLKKYEKDFEEKGMPLLAKEYSQIYEIVLGIFDKIVELLGEEKVTLTEYGDLLETGFVEAKVGVIPPGVDQILVGDIERTRLKDIRALFFLGVNEGIVPKSGGKGGIISDMEREMLFENQITLAPTQRQNAYMQQFYLYLNLTKPKERLYITYHKVDTAGKTALPSYLIGKLQNIFPDIVVEQEEHLKPWEEISEKGIHQLLGADIGQRYFLQGLGRYGEINLADWWKELFSFYKKQPAFEEQLTKLIEGTGFINEENSLTSQVAEALYGKDLSNSVTRIERYAACAYAHFLQYGLQLQERQEFRFGGLDFGNIFHEVLRIFPAKLAEKNYGWRTVPEEILIELAEQCIREVTADYGNQILSSSYRHAYMVERMTRMIKRTLWALSEQLKMGEFEPTDYEMAFSYMDGFENTRMNLEKERVMRLYGRIDRIDSYQEQLDEKDAIYVKVIDYKTGSTKFQIQNLYYGLQMQLVVYMNAALEQKETSLPAGTDAKVVPAGIFYYNIDDPIIERKGSEEELREAILKELKMNGLVNEEVHLIQLLDRSFGKEEQLNGSVKSLAIPVDTTKDGKIGSYSTTATKEQFALLGAYANHLLTKQGKEIVDGNISISPYRMDKKTACDYCNFRPICNFDTRLPGNRYRDLKKMGKGEIWENIGKELSEDKQSERKD
ncbi:MAG: helicase-exonuclease AddAB subunit AddB [Lachnospiraceae bacterium]|nr:helicase-exonuclease AddAB subunit AddB [Lachnospiraceae bacterium]